MSDYLNITEKFSLIRNYTVQICEPLETEDCVCQPADFASPPKWHLSHTTWFFEEIILKNFVPNYKPFNSQYSFLFNSYYNSLGERVSQNSRGNLSRPTVAEIFDYRKHVDHCIHNLLNENNSSKLKKLIEISLNHEQQHQELLLTDLKLILGLNPLKPIYKNSYCLVEENITQPSSKNWLHIKEGTYKIGAKSKNFRYDNEQPQHRVFLEEFSIQSELVTNEDYLKFILDQGYNRYELWLDEGWKWVSKNQIKFPLYWEKHEDNWFYYTLSGFKEINWDAPLCHVSFYEAHAFSLWRKMRLPTEFEWEASHSKFNFGTRWEWTNSAYLPYPNYQSLQGSLAEYNGKFMINQIVLRGGSIATPHNHSRPTYRNFFHPHTQWQFSGVRLVK